MTDNPALTLYNPADPPIRLAGFAWFARDRVYHRLPRIFPKSFRVELECVAAHGTGGQIQFQTDSARVAVKVKLNEAHSLYHMTAVGQGGFDCYIGPPCEQYMAGITRFDRAATEYEAVVLNAPDRQLRNVTLNFPLYSGVEEVQIGLDDGAQLLAPPPYADDRPIIVYGTSITQGGFASRPGMLPTNILSRWSNRPYINLGFSANGKGDPEVAEAMVEIPNPALFVLDYEANAHLEGLKNTLETFIGILRATHLKTPILVVSRLHYNSDQLDPASEATRLVTRDFQRDTVERLSEAGDEHLAFLDGGPLLGGDDYFECTVDGGHPTDLGFLRIAQGWWPVINSLTADRLIV